MDIGWTRELWVFVNGKLVYADKNLFEMEGLRKFPDARCSLENGAAMLPLEPGKNEIAVALANNFFWVGTGAARGGSGRRSAGREMSQEIQNMSRCLRQGTLDRLFTTATDVLKALAQLPR